MYIYVYIYIYMYIHIYIYLDLLDNGLAAATRLAAPYSFELSLMLSIQITDPLAPPPGLFRFRKEFPN